jgi:hypothetical protein
MNPITRLINIRQRRWQEASDAGARESILGTLRLWEDGMIPNAALAGEADFYLLGREDSPACRALREMILRGAHEADPDGVAAQMRAAIDEAFPER